MEGLSWRAVCLSALCVVLFLRPAAAIRFVIDREECFSHNVEYEGDTVHVSFVVIKAETPWHYSEEGVDLVVKDPNGAQVRDSRDKTSDKFEFIVQKRGVHHFCFTNKSPYHETIDFDVHVGHFSYFDQHAKDEHFAPLFEQIAKLDEALYNIQFEQHWLEAQTDRQAICKRRPILDGSELPNQIKAQATRRHPGLAKQEAAWPWLATAGGRDVRVDDAMARARRSSGRMPVSRASRILRIQGKGSASRLHHIHITSVLKGPLLAAHAQSTARPAGMN
ncbi:hypothetical protein PR202_ga21637 [Eleusine coracana subsp. coracana]|uniref:GOLD domain-containing protein n=1 Tax=Eleusine coracana subsp. coracana TaxID=191504 RepID=A0AAV5D211_ELECO|nr:hypothetical protein PR202_ga21637 [Eleusine coracana subsp. coracana]